MKPLMEYIYAGEPMPFPIIDVHGHIGRFHFGIPQHEVSEQIKQMDRLGVQEIWSSHMFCMNADSEAGNEVVLDKMNAHPARIRGYVSVFPKSRAWVKEQVQKYLALNFVGIKLHNYTGFEYDDPCYEPLYELANDGKRPILFHTWGGYEEFRSIELIAKKYNDVRLLLAHTGSCNEEGYIEIAKNYPNISLELALSKSPLGLVERLVESVGAGQVIWGSDSIFLNMAHQIGKVVGADISDADKKVLLSENALELLDRIV